VIVEFRRITRKSEKISHNFSEGSCVAFNGLAFGADAKDSLKKGADCGHTIPLSIVAGRLRYTVAGKLLFARNGYRFLESG
jgi:hypothetical protein